MLAVFYVFNKLGKALNKKLSIQINVGISPPTSTSSTTDCWLLIYIIKIKVTKAIIVCRLSLFKTDINYCWTIHDDIPAWIICLGSRSVVRDDS